MRTEQQIHSDRRQFLQYIIAGTLALILAILILPAPYNPRYLFKRAFYTPTFVCRDGVYSFAATSQGACSGHGGIASRYR